MVSLDVNDDVESLMGRTVSACDGLNHHRPRCLNLVVEACFGGELEMLSVEVDVEFRASLGERVDHTLHRLERRKDLVLASASASVGLLDLLVVFRHDQSAGGSALGRRVVSSTCSRASSHLAPSRQVR